MVALVKNLLEPYPKLRLMAGLTYRRLRAVYLRLRYPQGGYVTCNGVKVYCDFSSKLFTWYDGISDTLAFESNVLSSLLEQRTPDVVLDIGAHWGFFSAFLDTCGSARAIRKLIAVEPDPNNQRLLAKTLQRISNFPVMQLNAAIADTDGEVNLYVGMGSCSHAYYSEGTTSIGSARAITLDSIANEYLQDGETITHIKLDIDGFEPSFFKGGYHTLQKFKPIIFMEFWARGLKASGCDLESYWAMLQDNYEVEEAAYLKGKRIPLGVKDLPYLVERTAFGTTNLVLTPRS